MATSVLEFLITAKDEASGTLKGLSDYAPKIGTAFTIIGGAITGALALSVKSAAEAQEKMASVNATLATMSGVTSVAKERLLAAAQATVNLGFDDEDAALSITKFYQRTNDLNESIKLNQVAMDLARAKHIDLAQASTLVGQVLAGNGRVLKQYGIDLKEAGSPLEALGELSTKVGGQATAFADTFAGKLAILNSKFDNIKETIGDKLIPILTKLLDKYVIPAINKFQEWADANPELLEKIVMLTGAIGGLMVIIGPLLLALPTLSAAFAILSGPVGIVIAIIIALGVAVNNVVQIVLLLRDHWREVWAGIVEYAKEFISQIISYFQPFISILQTVYDKLTQVFSAAGRVVGSVVSAVGSAVTGKRALGGGVRSDSSYIVGENGPEIFSPSSSGYISPNGALAGVGGVTVNINGGYYLDQNAALDMGNKIIAALKRVSKIGL